MYAKSLFRRIQYWGYSNDFLRNIWRAVIPASIRTHITNFSLLRDSKLKLRALSEIIIDDIESKRVNCEKAEEVLIFLKTHHEGMMSLDFAKIWAEKRPGAGTVFNFNGALIPDCKGKPEILDSCIHELFVDTFLFHALYNDDYSKELVNRLEKNMPEGPYGYTDGGFDVTVKEGDTVIDAGAFVGDFAAYAAARGAFSYAFEPVTSLFEVLKKTAELHSGKIKSVQKGLGNINGEVEIFLDGDFPSSNSLNTTLQNGKKCGGRSMISITTLDDFVESENLKKIDFIKADIEGAERDMLYGAKNVLKEFAPKLSICTYHLPDDPQVLERIILEANPRYKVRQGPKKLYAYAM
ncbi:MAG: FkbM family methyltransferase [Spirochaetaceae bacterium]|jgi:FkbM family methyltransferase|nr:FkbM family methyltransferase [Spirochaetaceae bacterium]